jgi:hypothetical protein
MTNFCAMRMSIRIIVRVFRGLSIHLMMYVLHISCGVFYKVHKKHRPATLSKFNKYLGNSNSNTNSDTGHKLGAKIRCTNCNATATPMWRKAPDGSLLCNACAL